jgi:eukaryotic-like serine/threonine-protein kinase
MSDRRTTEVVADRYQLEEVIGRGGWGRVWRARDRLLGRDVAVKEVTVPEELAADRGTAEERVLREARAAARIPHPGAVTVYDVVRHEGTTYIIMELLRGRSLSEVVAEEGPLPPGRAAEIGRDVLATLRAAHDQGIVHRDVKPGNVMITDDDRVRLTDFGIATLRDQASLTLSGQVLGSPQYMAPEQAQGLRSSPATDLWGLGATLYFAVEGRTPFGREHPLATLNAVVNEPQPRPRRAGALGPVIEALLRKEPSARPDAGRAAVMLDEATGERSPVEEPTAPVSVLDLFDEPDVDGRTPAPAPDVAAPAPETPPTEEEAAPDRERRRPWPAILLGLALLLVAGFLWFLATLPEPAGEIAREPRNEEPTTTPDQPSPSRLSPGEPSPAQPSPGESSPGGVPQGWTRYADPAVGYTIAHPEEWEVSPLDDTRTDFRDPETGTLLRVDWTDQPGPDPVAAWESYSKDFAADHEGYEEIRIDPAEFQGYEAAEWEFTFVSGGTTLHAVDLGFVTGDHGFALFFQAPEDQWADMQDEFEAFKGSFRAPS